jgi:2,4-dienoyl-CoA reductase-like NADH-dependent reductase (Old Yellow Enzyme family)
MCQYSSNDGMATDWHLVHLGSRAVGGAGLVMVEATAVEKRGRISPEDMGIWDNKHIEPLARIARFVKAQGAVSAIQLAHAGRKASVRRPWDGGKTLLVDEGGWPVVGPSAVPFSSEHHTPASLSINEIRSIVYKFRDAATRAVKATFDLIEIHAAHGYLLHSFLSPLANRRSDEYGGSLENRMRIVMEVIDEIRSVIPDSMPVFMRISATDWVPGGWDIDQSVELAKEANKHGVDLIDCSSGAIVPYATMPIAPGYQVPFAEKVKADAKVATGAVGLITEPAQAEEIIASGKADIVLLARELLREPYWPMKAAKQLNFDLPWPPQYLRAKPH